MKNKNIWLKNLITKNIFASLTKKKKEKSISILSPSDSDPDKFRQYFWGDYWVKYELTKAIGSIGYKVVDVDFNPDVVIHLFGYQSKLPKNAFKILWIYSHPEDVNTDLLRNYDKIYTLSDYFTKKIRRLGFEAHTLLPATAKLPTVSNYKYDVVFVGNAHKDGTRKIINDIGKPNFNLKIWGRNYKYLSKKYRGGYYIDYNNLENLYSASKIVLNDHTNSMTDNEFVAVRVCDVLASGGFCISDYNKGIKKIFGDTVPMYKTIAELKEIINLYLKNENLRKIKQNKAQTIALKLSWKKRAKKIIKDISFYETS